MRIIPLWDDSLPMQLTCTDRITTFHGFVLINLFGLISNTLYNPTSRFSSRWYKPKNVHLERPVVRALRAPFFVSRSLVLLVRLEPTYTTGSFCLFPSPDADGPALVRVNIYIRSISRIDDVTMVSVTSKKGRARESKWSWVDQCRAGDL